MEIKRAVSLYSYQENFYLGKLDLEGCIAQAAKTGATGIELIPEQNCADEYLDPSDKFVGQWNEWMAKYSVEPCCLDIFYDYKLYGNRILTWGEQVSMYTSAFRFAKKLGFPIVRGMLTTPIKLVEMMIPIAQDMGVKMGIEIHSPYSLQSKYCLDLYELADKYNTKCIGIIPDTGIYVARPSATIVNKFIRAGAKKEIADYVCKAYLDKVPQDQAAEQVSRMDPGPLDHAVFKRVYFANYDDPQLLGKYIDYILHVHGKCWQMLDNCTEASVDTETPLRVLMDHGYTGYIATEYEGQRYFHDMGCQENADEIEEVRRHQEMLRRLISSLSSKSA